MGSRFILTINTVIWPNYYGRSHLGSIRGVATSGMMLSTALGPLPFALLYDLSGTYSTAILIFLSPGGLRRSCSLGPFTSEAAARVRCKDHQEAVQLLDRAAALFQEHGAQLYLGQVLDKKESLGA